MSMHRFISGSEGAADVPAPLVDAVDECILCEVDFECVVFLVLACFDDFVDDFALPVDDCDCAALVSPDVLLWPCASADATASTPPAASTIREGIRVFMR
jgi:hypothetical protein